MAAAATGEFHQDGWYVRQPHEDVHTTQFASAHESHHKQLQDSTSFGALARVYHELGVANGNRRYSDLGRQLTEASRFVQEAFASWLPAAALSWSPAELIHRYPRYRHYYDALDALVSSVASPYLRFHAAHALCRACMQTTAIDTALAAGLDTFSLADLRNRDLPDSRAAMLRRDPPDWTPAIETLFANAERDSTLYGLLTADALTASLFDPVLDEMWRHVNETMYRQVTDVLSAHGSTSLSLDGHLEQTPALVAAARRIAGGLDLDAGHPRQRSEVLAVVIGNIEAETFSVAAPLAARVLPPGTPLDEMVADVESPHLFFTLRATDALLANYAILSGEQPEGPVSAVARRTIVEPDGRRIVELLPIAEDTDLHQLTAPPVVVVPMSLVSAPGWHGLTRGPALRRAAFLIDVPLAPYLDVWTSRPGTRFRYAFLRIESFGRVVPFLVATVEHAGATEWTLLLRPLSHAGVRIHKAALEERDPTRQILVEDGGFMAARHDLIELSLAHLVGEEVIFGPGVFRVIRRGVGPT